MQTQTRRWSQHRSRMTGHVLGMCASSQKRLALATGKSKQWISRVVREGEGPVGSFVETIERLAAFGGTDAMVLAALPISVAMRGSHETLDDDDLASAIEIAMEEEQRREGRENMASLRYGLHRCADAGERDELRDALLSEAAAALTLLSLLLEQDRRAVEGLA